MPRISRNQFIVGMQAVKGIQSATWNRRVNKKVNRCTACNTEIAKHRGQDYCNLCQDFVRSYQVHEASEGDQVTMQFISNINHQGTKNWTPSGGQCFGVATREQAEEIKRRKGLVGVTKMSETETGDLRAVPRVIPVYDVVSWRAEGVDYEIVD